MQSLPSPPPSDYRHPVPPETPPSPGGGGEGRGVDSLHNAVALATDTRRVILERGATRRVGECFISCFAQHGEAPEAVVVADETTYEIAGRAAEQSLRAAGVRVRAPHVFPVRPAGPGGEPLHADYHHAVWLAGQLADHAAVPVAAGSGTINDLTKLGAHLAGRPYMVVATAASMDGYAAFGAAITRDGFKQTISCPAPRAVVADVDVLAAAPPEMNASGFGDLAGKLTAGADWQLADALGVEPIDPAIWELVQPAVREALAGAERLPAGDPAAVEQLFACLTMSGLAMQAARSSRPASGAEHQLSHLWEMRGLTYQGHTVSHGFKVAVGTVLVAELYERLLALDITAIDVDAARRGWPALESWEAEVRQTHADADPSLREQAVDEVRAKHVTPPQLDQRLASLRVQWPALRERLRDQLLPATEIRRLLDAAGCPSRPEQIGLTPEQGQAALGAARQIRRRYTVLDTATEVGLLPWPVPAAAASTTHSAAGSAVAAAR